MEIDILCESRKIAIEIDGDFHFAERENYRRDRRKDLLLQQAGYIVLRFLAEDVIKCVDLVLNTIIKVFESRKVKN